MGTFMDLDKEKINEVLRLDSMEEVDQVYETVRAATVKALQDAVSIPEIGTLVFNKAKFADTLIQQIYANKSENMPIIKYFLAMAMNFGEAEIKHISNDFDKFMGVN